MGADDEPAVAVITPTRLHSNRLPNLEELYESLCAQGRGVLVSRALRGMFSPAAGIERETLTAVSVHASNRSPATAM